MYQRLLCCRILKKETISEMIPYVCSLGFGEQLDTSVRKQYANPTEWHGHNKLYILCHTARHGKSGSAVTCDSILNIHCEHIVKHHLLPVDQPSFTCIGQAKLKHFADDIKLYSSFKVDVFNCGDLQQSLDLLLSWAKSWQLNINISKCSIFLPSKIHHKSKSIIPHTYLINESQLTNTSTVSDLGILVDSHLTFIIHINNILTKATQIAGVFSVDFHHATLNLLDNYL